LFTIVLLPCEGEIAFGNAEGVAKVVTDNPGELVKSLIRAFQFSLTLAVLGHVAQQEHFAGILILSGHLRPPDFNYAISRLKLAWSGLI
jgi:hypothetical protein